MQNKIKFKSILIEERISSKLFLICSGLTFLTMFMMVVRFFTRGAFPPAGIGIFYLGVLIIYALHKEAIRWLDGHYVQKRGEMFVYSWIVLVALLFLINFLTKDYFVFTEGGEKLDTLSNASILTLEVSAIFIFSRLLKFLKLRVIGHPRQ